MKQAEIKNGTDYIIGPSRNLWEHAEYQKADEDVRPPWKMARIHVIDARPHKVWSLYQRDPKPPVLVAEGEKPNRSHYTVGALAIITTADGTARRNDPVVIKPQDVRMEYDAWRTEYLERGRVRREAKARALEDRITKEKAAQIAAADRARRVNTLNDVLTGTGVKASILGTEVVLTGSPQALLDLAHARHKELDGTVPGTVLSLHTQAGSTGPRQPKEG